MEKAIYKIEQQLAQWGRGRNNKLVVGIDGYSGSGKTTILKKLSEQNPNILPVYMDDFATVSMDKNEAEKNTKLYSGILLLKFNNDEGLKKLQNVITEYKKDLSGGNVLVIEGVFLLYESVLAGFLDKLIYLDVDFSVSEERRIKREKERWGKNYYPENDPGSFVGGFKVNYKKYIELYNPKENADLVLKID